METAVRALVMRTGQGPGMNGLLRRPGVRCFSGKNIPFPQWGQVSANIPQGCHCAEPAGCDPDRDIRGVWTLGQAEHHVWILRDNKIFYLGKPLGNFSVGWKN